MLTMRKRVATSVVMTALAFAPIASGQARRREADVRALDQLQKRVDAAIVGGDVETYVTLITADAVLMPPNAPPIIGREAIREWSRNNAKAMVFQAYQPADAELTISGDWAFRRATFTATLAPASGGPAVQDTGKFIIIYQRQRDGSWKVARDIWNSSRSAAPAAGADAGVPERRPSLDGRCQLRAYTINRGKLEDFRRAWLAGVHPLRLRHGFTIPAAWSVAETNQFMWVLCSRGPESFEAKDAAYYASTERQVLDPDPRQFIARAEQSFIVPTLPHP
jgi:ketosteroid isomerase-like protein